MQAPGVVPSCDGLRVGSGPCRPAVAMISPHYQGRHGVLPTLHDVVHDAGILGMV